MVYGDLKHLPRRTTPDKILSDKTFNFAKNKKHDGYQREIASMAYKCFYEKSAAMRANKSATHKGTWINTENQQWADQSHKSIIERFEKHKVYSQNLIKLGIHTKQICN